MYKLCKTQMSQFSNFIRTIITKKNHIKINKRKAILLYDIRMYSNLFFIENKLS